MERTVWLNNCTDRCVRSQPNPLKSNDSCDINSNWWYNIEPTASNPLQVGKFQQRPSYHHKFKIVRKPVNLTFDRIIWERANGRECVRENGVEFWISILCIWYKIFSITLENKFRITKFNMGETSCMRLGRRSICLVRFEEFSFINLLPSIIVWPCIVRMVLRSCC